MKKRDRHPYGWISGKSDADRDRIYGKKEEGAYMRDYVMDQNGRLESLTFTDVDELNVDKFGLSVLTP